jgi:hypothetical protein
MTVPSESSATRIGGPGGLEMILNKALTVLTRCLSNFEDFASRVGLALQKEAPDYEQVHGASRG